MFGGGRYFGLRGWNLNLAVGIIAGKEYARILLILITDDTPGIDFFLFGYDQGVMGGLLTLGSFVRTFPEIDAIAHPNDTHMSTIQGITVASYTVGCFVGAIITIFIGDLLGRRRMIFL